MPRLGQGNGLRAIVTLCLLAAPITLSVPGGVARLGGETNRDQQAAMLGASALWQSGSLLLGGSFDGSSRIGSLYIGEVRFMWILRCSRRLRGRR